MAIDIFRVRLAGEFEDMYQKNMRVKIKQL